MFRKLGLPFNFTELICTTYSGSSFFCASFLMTLLDILSSAMSNCSPAHCITQRVAHQDETSFRNYSLCWECLSNSICNTEWGSNSQYVYPVGPPHCMSCETTPTSSANLPTLASTSSARMATLAATACSARTAKSAVCERLSLRPGKGSHGFRGLNPDVALPALECICHIKMLLEVHFPNISFGSLLLILSLTL